jgi:hypothetical protein
MWAQESQPCSSGLKLLVIWLTNIQFTGSLSFSLIAYFFKISNKFYSVFKPLLYNVQNTAQIFYPDLLMILNITVLTNSSIQYRLIDTDDIISLLWTLYTDFLQYMVRNSIATNIEWIWKTIIAGFSLYKMQIFILYDACL